ncbi:DNA polymerase Y family protein [Paracoccus aminophilus]|uniref:DNA-directed DNA polymerase n=1 Tax=Paracoccus aminophilus JCM 7686 TaxID=1367847 RepID=S5XXC2_PARAH|nr:DNA polymerase IV [Paracoccus aminophilus]AGT09962.1 DNA polymerase IV [Paracoccus aminophilus JCM 7686]
MTPFRVLYIDMNSFFASVEQQLEPALRGKPVAITAVDSEAGACVAASYEAKAFGVRTGTRVAEARLLCPGIIFRASRHRVYVRFNLAVADVLDRHAELTHIRSVDEFQLALSGEAQTLEGAAALVRRLKAAVAAEVGPALRFSAGIGPNHLLAKIAGKLEKPDGFQWLAPENMPERIAHLVLDDLPGISRALKERLYRARVFDVPTLCQLDPRHARQIWRSVEGERFVRMLQGMDIPIMPTIRGGYGNSKVLSPEFRDPRRAYQVGRWLTEKAAARLRRDGRVAGRFSLTVSFLSGHSWVRGVSCFPTQDTSFFLRLHRALWRALWRGGRPGPVLSMGVNLTNVDLLTARQGDLLAPLAPAERTRGEEVSVAVDQINARFGDGMIRYGIHLPHPGFFERG